MFYTRKGDAGTTQLYGDGNRYAKSEPIFEALGTCDELNAYLGTVRSNKQHKNVFSIEVGDTKKNIQQILLEVQEVLFITQAEIAGAQKQVSKEHVQKIEAYIDIIETSIPPIQHFIIPGASHFSAQLDVARTVTRRLERRMVQLQQSSVCKISADTITYLNRLSSLFFALARLVEHKEGVSGDAPSYM